MVFFTAQKMKFSIKVNVTNSWLFKPEFVGARGVWLIAKCYLVQDQNKITKK